MNARAIVKAVTVLVIGSVVAGLWPMPGRAEDAPGCEGLEAYAQAMNEARAEAISNGDLDIDAFDALEDRDPTTFSSDDWTKLADMMLALNRIFQSVDPPDWAAELHQLRIEELGLWEQMARTVSTSGLLMAIAFTETLDELEVDANRIKSEIAKECPDFATAFADWGDFATITSDDQRPGADSADGPGTRNDPVPMGTAVEVEDGWRVTVVDVVSDATEIVLAESDFNDRPPAGQQYVLVRIIATYDGSDEPATFSSGPSLKVVGDAGVAYATYDPSCGSVPDELPSSRDVFKGGTIEGNVCWSIDPSDLDSLVMYADDSSGDSLVFFALKPSVKAPAATPSPAAP